MHMNFVVTMTPSEKKRTQEILVNTKKVLEKVANDIKDDKERADMWAEIRKFNNVLELFNQ
jgi:hypothetical protein